MWRLTLALALARPVLAHEGDPRPWAVHFPNADAARAWVVDEMGVLVERDEGFLWLCDNAISQTEGLRQAFPVSVDGRRWMVTTRGHVRFSDDAGCTFAPAPGAPFAGHRVGPVSVHANQPEQIVVSTASLGRPNDLFHSFDGGRTWTRAGLDLASGVHSLVRGPDGSQTLYGLTLDRLLRSEDGGQSAELLTPQFEGIEDAQFEAFRLLHVADRRADQVVYGALDHFPDGVLVRSDDAGQTWVTVTSVRDDVVESLVEGPDGALVFSAPFTGLFRSTDGGATWARIESPGLLGCLARDPRTGDLWGCLRGTPLPWIVASTSDLGDTWTPRLQAYADIAGQIPCPVGTPTQAICSQECDPADRACTQQGAPDAGVPDAGAEADRAVTDEGCAQAPLAAPWWLALLALRRRRRQGELVAGS